jgi:hypothetical protein
MKTDDNFLVGIIGAVAYIWGMFLLASYLMQSSRLISSQGGGVIEEGFALLF